MSSRAGRASAMALMRRRTASGKPRERGGCAAPAREGGFFAGFVVFDVGFERAAACFTGEGRGCGENNSQLLCVLENDTKRDAPCPSLPWTLLEPICSSPCSLSGHGYTTCAKKKSTFEHEENMPREGRLERLIVDHEKGRRTSWTEDLPADSSSSAARARCRL